MTKIGRRKKKVGESEAEQTMTKEQKMIEIAFAKNVKPK